MNATVFVQRNAFCTRFTDMLQPRRNFITIPDGLETQPHIPCTFSVTIARKYIAHFTHTHTLHAANHQLLTTKMWLENNNYCCNVSCDAAADLGMFGRTGAPQKWVSTKGAANFCTPEKWVIPEWKESDEQKKGRQFLRSIDSWHTDGQWWLKSFSRKNRVCRPSWRAPTFFSCTGPCCDTERNVMDQLNDIKSCTARAWRILQEVLWFARTVKHKCSHASQTHNLYVKPIGLGADPEFWKAGLDMWLRPFVTGNTKAEARACCGNSHF